MFYCLIHQSKRRMEGMQKLLFMILITLIIFPSPAYSKTMYVIDKITITVRKQPGLDFKVIGQLTSGEAVNILRTEESWAQIPFKDDKTGWVMRRYLTEETPKPIQIAELKKTVNTQAETIATLEKENTTLKQSKAAMVEIISNLKLENQSLKEVPYRIILLLTGVGIFLFGCIVSLIIQRKNRRKSSLSF